MYTHINMHAHTHTHTLTHSLTHTHGMPTPRHRSYIKTVFVQALLLGLGQSLIFYIYCAAYSLSARLIIEERTTYDRAFRSAMATFIIWIKQN